MRCQRCHGKGNASGKGNGHKILSCLFSLHNLVLFMGRRKGIGRGRGRGCFYVMSVTLDNLFWVVLLWHLQSHSEDEGLA